jgi:plasmid maintenance system killer protein
MRMQILPLDKRLIVYLGRHGLVRQFEKQKRFFEANPLHPSLNTELLEPKHLRIYSFRITRNYRAIFIYCGDATIEIIDVNNHYR